MGGLSQRELGRRAGVAQSMVSTYEHGGRQPTLPTLERLVSAAGAVLDVNVLSSAAAPSGTLSLAETGGHLSGAEEDEPKKRLILGFLEGYGHTRAGDRATLLAGRPGPTGDRRFDAFVGGLAEHLAYHDLLTTPAWSAEPERFLDSAWFWSDLPSLRTRALIHSPASFRRRGIFVDPHDLGRV